MADNQSSPRPKRLVLLVWLLVAFFYFYLSYDYVHAGFTDRSFDDYLHYVVQLGGNDRRPSKEIRALLLIKASQLGIPLQDDRISIFGEGRSLEISCDYSIDFDLPGFQRAVYRKTFNHDVRYSQDQASTRQ